MTSRRTRRSLAGATLAVLSLIGLAACGGSDSAGGAVGADSQSLNGPQKREAVPSTRDQSFAASGDSAPGTAAGRQREPADSLDPTAPPDPTDAGQQPTVISTGNVALRADDVSEARFDAIKIVDQHLGNVSDEKSEADDTGKLERTRLVLRVPAKDFDVVMHGLDGVAHLITTSSTSEDVTTQVIDTDVRVRTQRASIARIRILLDRADSIRDVISIESELNQRQADLDSLERRQAYLADQTSMATITLSIERTDKKAAKSAPKHHDRGFVVGLEAGWSGLSKATVAVLTAGGAVLPFAVVLLVIGVPGWLIWRRRARGVAA